MSIGIPASAILLLIFGACAGTPAASERPAPVTLNYRHVTTSEVRNVVTAYDALMKLRPYLSGWRAALLVQGPAYLDDRRLGAPAQLRTVPGGAVWEIRLLEAAEATARFGTDHPLGAIVVVTRTGR